MSQEKNYLDMNILNTILILFWKWWWINIYTHQILLDVSLEAQANAENLVFSQVYFYIILTIFEEYTTIYHAFI